LNFLDLIWLIPLFPLCGALLMLLSGRLLDPQPVSDVAVAPGVEHTHDEHDHHHDHGHSHSHEHGSHHHRGSPLKVLVSLLCPGWC
jgi:ABC-type nickel/cobalt efflux system permease component RcnA